MNQKQRDYLVIGEELMDMLNGMRTSVQDAIMLGNFKKDNYL